MGSPYLYYDGARVSPESKIGKELLKFEKKPDWTPEKNQLPRMLYRAMLRPDGRRSVSEVLDSVCGGWPGAAHQFTASCQKTVHTDDELQRSLENGWRKHPLEALEYLEKKEEAKSNETAERHAKDVHMSFNAQAEADAADKTTLKQLPEIPRKPVRKYVKKNTPAAD